MAVKYYYDKITVSVTFNVLVPNNRATEYRTLIYMRSYNGDWIYVDELQRSRFDTSGMMTISTEETIRIPPFVSFGSKLKLRFLVKPASGDAKPFELEGDDIFETDVDVEPKIHTSVIADRHGLFGAYSASCNPSDERSTYHVDEDFYVYQEGPYPNDTGIYIVHCIVSDSHYYGNNPVSHPITLEHFTEPGKGWTRFCMYWKRSRGTIGSYRVFVLFGTHHFSHPLTIIE